MTEPSLRNVTETLYDNFDVEMAEVRDPHTGQAIVSGSVEPIYDWLNEKGFDVEVRDELHYDDGDVSGTPVEFRIPSDYFLFYCNDCGEVWVGRYDEEWWGETEREAPQQHELETEHWVVGL